MAQPVLKSIHPVNLLSFGPKTEPIELRPLNILIGPNGSGKSNLIEAIRLLHFLPDKDPWSAVLATGGVGEWIWKGAKNGEATCSLKATICFGKSNAGWIGHQDDCLDLSIELESFAASLRVKTESIGTCSDSFMSPSLFSRFERSGSQGSVIVRDGPADHIKYRFDLNVERSVLSQLGSPQASRLGGILPEVFEAAEVLERFDFQQDWEFGWACPARRQQPVGQPVDRLRRGGRNLAQMLAHYRDHYKPVFEQLTDLARRFYEPVKSVEVRLISTDLQIAIEEEGGFSTPASRLSDGMLRWLALLCILLNPTPPPVTCLDEPELGFHPDIIPTLADLLRDASKKTQLIVTTHSSELVDAFSDDSESVCVCEKIHGSTVIRRLSQPDLHVWLKDYSLGNLWTSGEIGGNRW
jgi:predicted ATPase